MRYFFIALLILCGLFFLQAETLLAQDAELPDEARVKTMLGQMIMVGFRGTGTDQRSDELSLLLNHIAAGRVGGVILFDIDVTSRKAGRNIVSPMQLKKLINCLRHAAPADAPVFIGIDQEGGLVQRLKPAQGFKRWPSPKQLGQLSASAVFQYGKELGAELKLYGFNVDFAPSLDVNVNPASPIIGALGRSFSTSPSEVTLKAGAFADGLNAAGLIACFKHFPGHGSALSDTHHNFTDITATWNPDELLPYWELLPKGGSRMVMIGHLFLGSKDAQYPASLSHSIITGLLRRELGWNGVIVSDDMQMAALASYYSPEESMLLAVNAGTDILVFGNNIAYDPNLASRVYGTLWRLYLDGKISPQRIQESYNRIMNLKKQIK